ncbi:MAG: hypothetical protein H7X88_09800, partial [Gloeobacteraceae cyanobacterium ES-bin-316]|nr:hypothetical protein [Ferruginibacter sp.]
MRPASFILSLLLFLHANTALAQSIFELRYQEAGTESNMYNAFLVANESGTGFVRVHFLSPVDQQKILVEMTSTLEFVTDANGETDTTQFFYKTSNPIIIKGNAQALLPAMEFWFKVNALTKLAEPAFVKIATTSNGGQSAALLASTLLSTESMNKELL